MLLRAAHWVARDAYSTQVGDSFSGLAIIFGLAIGTPVALLGWALYGWWGVRMRRAVVGDGPTATLQGSLAAVAPSKPWLPTLSRVAPWLALAGAVAVPLWQGLPGSWPMPPVVGSVVGGILLGVGVVSMVVVAVVGSSDARRHPAR